MGNICSGEKPEARKQGAFDDVGLSSSDPMQQAQHGGPLLINNNNNSSGQQSNNNNFSQEEDPATKERLKAMREEQARLDLIVSTAGRGMVAVRSTRGSTGYYDQGFAAALAQHLEQTTEFPNTLSVRLPPPSSQGVYKRLGEPLWEDICLGTKDGLAGCAGENPNTYMDHVAESFLETTVTSKQELFSGVHPMIENLL
jgi:hypothetical protein